MKITFAIKQKDKFVKTTTKVVTKKTELEGSLLHDTIDKAYEILCKHDGYDAVVITLRKEVK